jgi:hypothetical protein
VPSKTPSEVSALLIWLIDERLKINGLERRTPIDNGVPIINKTIGNPQFFLRYYPSEALHGIPHPSLPLHHFLSIQAIEFNSYIDPIKSIIPSLLPSGGEATDSGHSTHGMSGIGAHPASRMLREPCGRGQ